LLVIERIELLFIAISN